MPYKFFDHTADVRLLVTGETPEELFRNAVRGMMEFLSGEINKEGPGKMNRTIRVCAADSTALLVDFLNEVLSSAAINKEIYGRVVFKKLIEKEVEAELDGIPVSKFEEDIKSVTYHEAEIKRNADGGLEVTLIFDI